MPNHWKFKEENDCVSHCRNCATIFKYKLCNLSVTWYWTKQMTLGQSANILSATKKSGKHVKTNLHHFSVYSVL